MAIKSHLLKCSAYLLSLVVMLTAATGCSDLNSPTAPVPLDFTPPVRTAYPPPAQFTSPAGHAYPPPIGAAAAVIPFKSLSRGFRLGGSVSEPALMVVLDRQELAVLEQKLSQEDFKELQGIDLRETALLAVFWGQKPSGGFSIRVDRILLAEDTLVVNVTLREEDPEFPRIEAVTSPYHLVLLDSGLISGKVRRLVLQSRGQVLASTEVR